MIYLDVLKPEIAFDGWAIAIIVFLLSCCIGTYRYVTKSKLSQKQKAGVNSNQEQSVRSTSIKDENTISQSQKAGNNSTQKQTM